MKHHRILSFVLAGALAGCTGGDTSEQASALSGATFTTTADGTRVDANIYQHKADVYLDGGPGSHAPRGAAALPDGDYYFQVTDPSGHTLLSSDAIDCRKVHFAGGQITQVYACGNGQHVTGTDRNDGALTVQLMPYADTPNPGCEYKAWVMPVADYVDHFVPRYSKTDNFKVCEKSTTPPPPPPPPPPPVDAGTPPPPPDASCDANSGPA